MKTRERAARFVLICLGCFMAVSALEHWTASSELSDHYDKSVLGARGLTFVAIAQSLAAVGLLWRRTQRAAAFALATVMAGAALTHLVPGGNGAAALVPSLICATALAGALCLSRR